MKSDHATVNSSFNESAFSRTVRLFITFDRFKFRERRALKNFEHRKASSNEELRTAKNVEHRRVLSNEAFSKAKSTGLLVHSLGGPVQRFSN